MPTGPAPRREYSLEDVPAFLEPTAQHMKMQVGQPNGVDIAKVSPSDPNTVVVNQPDQFTQGDLNHETVHSYDLSRNPAVVAQLAKVQQQQQAAGMYTPVPGQLPKAYDYGGVEGLLAARQQGKTIANYGPEHPAQVARHWQAGLKDAIQRGDTAKFDLLNKAYAPFIRQEAN